MMKNKAMLDFGSGKHFYVVQFSFQIKQILVDESTTQHVTLKIIELITYPKFNQFLTPIK